MTDAAITAALAAFLNELIDRPFVFGETDCCTIIADWWMRVLGEADPIADVRGSYSTPVSSWRVLVAEGGVAAAVARRARASGAVRTDAPEIGDVAAVEYNGDTFAAIRGAGGRWVMKLNDNLTATRDVRLVEAWRLPCRS